MSELLHEYINELLREEAEVGALMRDVDDILDDALRDAAPEIVRDIREREVDEDIDEFIDGAMHGSWDTKELSYADVPNVGDHAEVRDEGDNEEVTEMYKLGYQWGWDNPGKIDKGENIPDGIRREMVEYALENFKSRLTEEFVINAFEKAIGFVKKQMGDVHDILKKAKEKFGWKFAPALVGIEVVEHAVLPTALGAIHPIFYGLAAVPTIEILAASALAIAKARMPATPKAELPPGHLDWYEDEYQKASNESLVRKYVRQVLCENKLSGKSIEGILDLLDGYSNNTWIFFDTETTGMHPDSAQLTEIGAIAVDPKNWESTSQVLGEFNEKIKLTDETEKLLNDPESEERKAWEKGNQQARKPLKEPQDVLSMTRYGESGGEFGDEQAVLDKYFEFVESFPNPLLIAQNASFDLKFLSVRSKGKMKKHPVLDTQQLMEMYLVPLLKTQTKAEEGDPAAQDLLDKLYVNKGNWGYHSVSMGVVSKAYDINIEDWHNALADVKMMMEMYKNVVQTIQQGMDTDISQEHGKAVSKRNRRKKR